MLDDGAFDPGEILDQSSRDGEQHNERHHPPPDPSQPSSAPSTAPSARAGGLRKFARHHQVQLCSHS